jgi:hypothetical protein
LQVRSVDGGMSVKPPPNVPRLIEAQGAVIGPGRVIHPERLIYVVSSHYGAMNQHERLAVARLVGAINRASVGRKLLMLGPGRWGTRDPWLGLPVSFNEINQVAALCEIVAMNDNLVPDVSLGTHFLNELIEADMLYFALFPDRTGNRLDERRILEWPNRLGELLPEARKFAEIVRVVDLPAGATLYADTERQMVTIIA